MLHQALEEGIYMVYESYIFNETLQNMASKYIRNLLYLDTFSSRSVNSMKIKFKTNRPTWTDNLQI